MKQKYMTRNEILGLIYEVAGDVLDRLNQNPDTIAKITLEARMSTLEMMLKSITRGEESLFDDDEDAD